MYAGQKSLGHLASTYDLPIEHRLIVFSVCLPEKASKGSMNLKLKVFDTCSHFRHFVNKAILVCLRTTA